MIGKFLKRFENLENMPADILVKKGIRLSKRFECLEIGETKISLTITDKIISNEKTETNTDHKIVCPYCGMDNSRSEDCCAFCKRVIKTKVVEEIQGHSPMMVRCTCGTMNQKDRLHCWFCGRNLNGTTDNPDDQSLNTITINVDGQIYRSTDKNLPPDIIELMNRIRKEGYKKEIVDEWVKEKKLDAAGNIIKRNTQLKDIQSKIMLRIFGLAAVILLIIIQINACGRYIHH